jgi:dTDP-glucose 4,6-dehydratase
MTLSGKKILVTGAGGFIGSHLVERLLGDGASVRAFLRYTARPDLGNLEFLPPELKRALEVVRGDLRDPEAVRSAVAGVDTVLHLGALIAIPYSYVNPREVFDVNVMGTLNVLAAARDAKVRRVVHTSTSEVFGTARYTPIDEAHPMQGQSPYSASKIGADRLAESFYRSFDVPVVTLRPFNTFGPRQSARAIIPTIMSQALTQPELKLGSLSPTRDFTFVSDTVDGFVRAATAEQVVGEELNLGTGVSVSIGDLVELVFKLTGKRLPIVTDEARIRPARSEVMTLLANNKKALGLMGWKPTVSLEQGLAQTLAWVKQNLNAFRPSEYTV